MQCSDAPAVVTAQAAVAFRMKPGTVTALALRISGTYSVSQWWSSHVVWSRFRGGRSCGQGEWGRPTLPGG